MSYSSDVRISILIIIKQFNHTIIVNRSFYNNFIMSMMAQ